MTVSFRKLVTELNWFKEVCIRKYSLNENLKPWYSDLNICTQYLSDQNYRIKHFIL